MGIERVKFPVEIVELKAGDVIKRGEYDIVTFPTEHRADTIGYALAEHVRLGRFNPEKARALGIPEGPLWGKIHKGETITLARRQEGRTGGIGRRASSGPEGCHLRRHPTLRGAP